MTLAEAFDVFGLMAFLMLFLIGFKIRKREKFGWIVIFISLVGLVADGVSVIKTFFIGG